MPHAEVENLVTCAAPECVQPGTILIPVGFAIDKGSDVIELEFCERCAVTQSSS